MSRLARIENEDITTTTREKIIKRFDKKRLNDPLRVSNSAIIQKRCEFLSILQGNNFNRKAQLSHIDRRVQLAKDRNFIRDQR